MGIRYKISIKITVIRGEEKNRFIKIKRIAEKRKKKLDEQT